MNIEQFALELSSLAAEKDVAGLIAVLSSWQEDDSSVLDLESRVERYIGNVWFEREGVHEQVYRSWSAFRREAIAGIGGMTMNERLYYFGLFPRYEAANSEGRAKLYEKLLARL